MSESFEQMVERNRRAPRDNRPDGSGLDDGPYLPGQAPRKKRTVDAETFSAERKRAWATRRAMYGPRGHR